MKMLILSVILSLGLPVFAQTQFDQKSILEEIKARYDGATQVPTIDDFTEVNSAKPQACSYWDKTKMQLMAYFGHYTKTWNEGGDNSGPLFRNRQKTKQTLVWQGNSSRWNDDIEKVILESRSNELYWLSNEIGLHFRKDAEYIYFIIDWGGNSHYGYCWKEKN